jgi:anti-sigma B factor antagonist
MREPRTDPSVANLSCVLERTSEAILVRAIGEIDLATIPTLWSSLTALLGDHPNVVVDLNGVQYIESAGIESLLDAHRLFIQSGQRLVLAESSRIFPMMLREIAGLEQAVPVFRSVAAALASFRSSDVLLPDPRYGTGQPPTNLKAA